MIILPRIGMARHDKSSFNEGKAVRLLAQFLEQNDTIKTIFKDNDRTPNYDGSMELVEEDGTPIKKFIVQIKKCENLEPNQIGPNKGKYVYPLETNFLHYVKEKVTESPAIYFVVDIATGRIFWLYLSDETLMNLEFEDKERVSYPFAETDILTDVAAFTKQLHRIALERNALFVYKTKKEIAEIQDALDYINGLLLNDFSVIKEQCFPNLWRVGLRCSRNHSISMLSNGIAQSTDKAVSFALYPQVKGELDTGIKDFCFLSNNFFNYTDMSGRTSPMEYARHVISRIVHDYFENRLPEMKFPEIAQYDQWDYDYWALLKLEPNEYMEQVNSIYDKWFDELPAKYHEVYDLLFEKRKYRFKGVIEYRNECVGGSNLPRWINTIVRRYKSQDLTISFNPECSDKCNKRDFRNGLIHAEEGELIQRFLYRQKLFSDAIYCLLYQGICEELELEHEGLRWDMIPFSLFN